MTFADHPELGPLHRAILLDPEDDAPRLIFADKLEELTGEATCEKCLGKGSHALSRDELLTLYGTLRTERIIEVSRCESCSGTGRVSNGYAERAEFIRVQVELARMPKRVECKWCSGDGHVGTDYHRRDRCDYCNGTGEAGDGSRRRVLQQRERELSRRYGLDWYALHAVDFTSRQDCEWSRGFIHKIVTTQSDFLAHAEALFREHPIQRVELSDRRPFSNLMLTGEMEYGFESHPNGGVDRTGMIASRIFDGLENWYRKPNQYRKWYRTQQAAIDAASGACVRLGRRLAELEPQETKELCETR